MIVMKRSERLSVPVDLQSVAFRCFPGADPVFDLVEYAEGDNLLFFILSHTAAYPFQDPRIQPDRPML